MPRGTGGAQRLGAHGRVPWVERLAQGPCLVVTGLAVSSWLTVPAARARRLLAGMSKLSSTLAAESKHYSSRAQDLHRQVGRPKCLPEAALTCCLEQAAGVTR